MIPEIYNVVTDLLKSGEPFAVASVINVRGSASAKPGSKAVINQKGRNLVGWVGGGCAESYVGSQAVEAMAEGRPRIIEVNLDDEIFGLGMPCGGFMDVYIEPHLPRPELVVHASASTLAATQHLVENLGMAFAPSSPDDASDDVPLPGRDVPPSQLETLVWSVFQAMVRARGTKGEALRERKGVVPPAAVMPFAVWPPSELLILGSSRISEELARLGVLLKWPVRLYGPRYNREDYPDAAQLLTIETLEAGYRNLQIKLNSAVVVASHHKGDPDYIKAAIAAKAGYVGLIASQKRSRLVFEDLIENGMSTPSIQTVHAPAGLDCGCITPQDIALSVIAEILSCR